MAVSGIIMAGYLLIHMYGNLKIFMGQEMFDSYLEGLRSIGYPYLPHGGALWILRVLLAASVLIHMHSAFSLWRRNRKAAAVNGMKRYESSKAPWGVQRSYASFTMRWGGVTLALFIVYHLLHFTAMKVQPGGATDSKYEAMVNSFSLWYVTLGYTIAILAVALHLRHGIWSALTTLGQNKSAQRRKQLNILAITISALIGIGFLIPPYAIHFGLVS